MVKMGVAPDYKKKLWRILAGTNSKPKITAHEMVICAAETEQVRHSVYNVGVCRYCQLPQDLDAAAGYILLTTQQSTITPMNMKPFPKPYYHSTIKWWMNEYSRQL